MNKQPLRLLFTVLLLGWVFDFLFWRSPIGINFVIYIVLILLSGFLLLFSYQQKPNRKSLWLILPMLTAAVFTFSRQEPLTLGLAYTTVFVCLGLLTATYLGGRWAQYGLLDYIVKFVHLIVFPMVDPITFADQVKREYSAREVVKNGPSIKPVLRGFAIALPIVAGFAVILASADIVFSMKIQGLFSVFSTERMPEYFIRFFIILFIAYFLAGVFLFASRRSTNEALIGQQKPILRPILGFTEAVVVLGSVATLFLAFVIIQFQYFFGGEVNIGVTGYTYSQYARSGFSELITVALLSLLLAVGMGAVTKRETRYHQRIFSGLSVVVLVLVLVMLVSAYQRLSLAIDWHGYSRLRVYPRLFMIWVGILFVAIVVLEMMHRERYFMLAGLVAAIGFVITLGLVNVDASIVHYNVTRSTRGKHFNVTYLTSLSIDAVPALVEDFTDHSLPERTRESIGAALLCYQNIEPALSEPPEDWRSWNWSQWRATQAMASVKSRFKGYTVNIERPLVQVGTPGDRWYVCDTTDTVFSD